MAIVPYKQWEEMDRWKQEQRPQLPPDPTLFTLSVCKKIYRPFWQTMTYLRLKKVKNTEKLYII